MKLASIAITFLPVFVASCASLPAGPGLRLRWEKNLLSIHSPELPDGKIEVWYLEAFCRPGSTRRVWDQTVIRHQTELLGATPDFRRLRLRSVVGDGDGVGSGVEVIHDIRAGQDEVDFQIVAVNRGPSASDATWLQPCIRVGGFTGRKQEDYPERCFIFVDGKLTTLDRARRTEEAIYHGGQVYVPAGISREDVNPRPLSPDVPSSGLIGCFSADGKRLLATAWEPYQELFQGVIICIHSDPRLGGLAPGERKTAHGKIYILANDPRALLDRYRRDFPSRAPETR